MRTAAEFNAFYAKPDPWRVAQSTFRNRIFQRVLPRYIRGRTVLELGCGEGHLTESVFREAKVVIGVDISDVAIDRATDRKLPNARFENADFLKMAFGGYDVIAALECIYYLSPDEQEAFFAKVAREHSSKMLILSGPIVGEGQHRRYFTHEQLVSTFKRHRMTIAGCHNVIVNRRGLATTAAAASVRLFPFLLDWLPEKAIFQRCYIIRIM